AAAAKLLKLDVDRSKAALGIAASLTGGLKRNFGTMTKPLHAGNAARNGVVAASLAKQGFTADESIFDGPENYSSVLGGGDESNLYTQDLGQRFNICSGLEIKPYPSCRATHAGIDAALQIRDKYTLSPADIAEIEYHTGSFIPLAAFHHQPQTGLEGKFSLEFCAALSFIKGRATLAQFTDEIVKKPVIQDLISKTRIIVDPEIPKDAFTPVEIRVKLKDGRVLSYKVKAAKGEPGNPLSREELVGKFRDCASVALSPKEVDRVLELASKLESLEDIDPLMKVMTFGTKKV
ncbi:MAG: MmgE/PrpD family protein, partial [Chloroflexota bacterium]|nr:MmgE/PrpD family protein [Chloroflexota bacterium]